MAKDITWGVGIDGPTMKALGLPGETPVKFDEWVHLYREWAKFHEDMRYHLPADHPYYTVAAHNAEHGTNFTLWLGGDEAPGDWDGGNVLRRSSDYTKDDNLGRVRPFKDNQRWTHDERNRCNDIIGYTKRAEPEAVFGDPEWDYTTTAIFPVPPGHVLVKQMTDFQALTWDRAGRTYLQYFTDLGLFLPPETQTERFTRETGIEATDEVAAALEWASKQGDG